MTKQKIYCSFCGASQDDAAVILEGPSVHICDVCVRNSVETLHQEGYWPVPTTYSLRRGLMALAAYIGPTCTDAVTAAMGDQPPAKEPSQ